VKEGWSIENYQCKRDSAFFYNVVNAYTSANGLQAGAPTDLMLEFGSLGNSVLVAYNPECFGLAIPGNGGKLVIILSNHFVYMGEQPTPNEIMELGVAPGNPILGIPCNDGDADVVCGNWNANLVGTHQIEIIPQGENGLTGRRALTIGVKFAHIHPKIATSKAMYCNAIGTCDSNKTAYCLNHQNCPKAGKCVAKKLKGTVTAMVVDSTGTTIHEATHSVLFVQKAPPFTVHNTNIGLTSNTEVYESVTGQYVEPGATADGYYHNGESFSKGGPYAPRFLVFGRKNEISGFPHAIVDVTGFVIRDDAQKVSIRSKGDEIGVATLTTPEQWAEAFFVQSTEYVFEGTLNDVGGTVFPLSIQVGDVPGMYSVQVTMKGGSRAVSQIFVPLPPSAVPLTVPSDFIEPSNIPTLLPTKETRLPTLNPSIAKSAFPTHSPTALPITMSRPNVRPTKSPTSTWITPSSPSPLLSLLSSWPMASTTVPTVIPLSRPESFQAGSPFQQASPAPIPAPTTISGAPLVSPSSWPNVESSDSPSKKYTLSSTSRPFVEPPEQPTVTPHGIPTNSPIKVPTQNPTRPTLSSLASSVPTGNPTRDPTIGPTHDPTYGLTSTPTTNPSILPTASPMAPPIPPPTEHPTYLPTANPTGDPTSTRTNFPIDNWTYSPATVPTTLPTTFLNRKAQVSRVNKSRPKPIINGGILTGGLALIAVVVTMILLMSEAARQLLFGRPKDPLLVQSRKGHDSRMLSNKNAI
jgi:hypothetical protein